MVDGFVARVGAFFRRYLTSALLMFFGCCSMFSGYYLNQPTHYPNCQLLGIISTGCHEPQNSKTALHWEFLLKNVGVDFRPPMLVARYKGRTSECKFDGKQKKTAVTVIGWMFGCLFRLATKFTYGKVQTNKINLEEINLKSIKGSLYFCFPYRIKLLIESSVSIHISILILWFNFEQPFLRNYRLVKGKAKAFSAFFSRER